MRKKWFFVGILGLLLVFGLIFCGCSDSTDGTLERAGTPETPEFVAVAYDSDKAAYSADGIKWRTATMPSRVEWFGVTYGNGKFVAVSNSDKAAYSADGIRWTAVTMPSSGWQGVAYGNGKFVAISYGSSKAAYSADGISWTETTMPSSAFSYRVAFGGE
jgi:hypothetical protein